AGCRRPPGPGPRARPCAGRSFPAGPPWSGSRLLRGSERVARRARRCRRPPAPGERPRARYPRRMGGESMPRGRTWRRLAGGKAGARLAVDRPVRGWYKRPLFQGFSAKGTSMSLRRMLLVTLVVLGAACVQKKGAQPTDQAQAPAAATDTTTKATEVLFGEV